MILYLTGLAIGSPFSNVGAVSLVPGKFREPAIHRGGVQKVQWPVATAMIHEWRIIAIVPS